MDNDSDTTLAISSLLIGVYVNGMVCRKKRKKRKVWVNPWIKAREDKGAYNALVSELSLTDREDYRRFMRMNPETFHELLEKVRPFIEKKTTNMRKPISAEEKIVNNIVVAVFIIVHRHCRSCNENEKNMHISQKSIYTM